MSIELARVVRPMDVPEAIAGEPEEAFRRISAQHVQAAYRLAWAILGDGAEAQDAAQDAFTSAWRQRFTLHDADKFDAWFSRILVNGCRDRLRRRARVPWPADIDEWPQHLYGSDNNAVAHDSVVGPPRHYQWTSPPDWSRAHLVLPSIQDGFGMVLGQAPGGESDAVP